MSRAAFVRKLLLPVVVLATGCGPTLLLSTMKNPALTTDKLESSQTYQIGPYRENHQYTVSIYDWTPSSLGMRVKLRDVDRCAQPDSYSFTLLDDHGARAQLKPTQHPPDTTELGRQHLALTVSQMAGVFPAAIGSATRYLVVQMRPLRGTDCPSLDFKWTLQ